MKNKEIKWKISSYPIYLIVFPILWVMFEILKIINISLFYNIIIVITCFIIFSVCFFNVVSISERELEDFRPFCFKKKNVKIEEVKKIIYKTSGRRLGKISICTRNGNISAYMDFMGKKSLNEMFDFFESKGIKVIRK